MASDEPLPQFDTDHPGAKEQFIKAVYQLGSCPECRTNYAVLPDPRFPSGQQFHIFNRDESLENATHICSGGILCLRGHELLMKPNLYIYNGKWISVGPKSRGTRGNG